MLWTDVVCWWKKSSILSVCISAIEMTMTPLFYLAMTAMKIFCTLDKTCQDLSHELPRFYASRTVLHLKFLAVCKYPRQEISICSKPGVFLQYQLTPNFPEVKGTVSRDFLLLVFSWISFPPASVANLPPVSTIPAANLPPVSTTPVAIYHRYQRRRRQICHRCHWEQYQAAETLKWTWRQKCIYRLTLLPKGV